MFPGLAEVTLCRRCSVGSGGTLASGRRSCVLLYGLHGPSVVLGLTAVGHWRGGWPPPQRWSGPALCGGCGIARWQGRILCSDSQDWCWPAVGWGQVPRRPGALPEGLGACVSLLVSPWWYQASRKIPEWLLPVLVSSQKKERPGMASASVCPQEEPQLLPASLTVSLRATGGSDPYSSNYCLSTGTGSVWVCVCSLRVESLFLVALRVSLLDVNVRHSGSSSSCCRSPGLGSLMWDQTPHSLGRTSATVWHSFCLWVSSLEGVGRDCVASMPLLLNSFFISLAVEKLWEIFLLASDCSQR